MAHPSSHPPSQKSSAKSPIHKRTSKPSSAQDFQGMAGRHEAENLASSFTGLISFVAKGAKHYAIMSSDPQYTPEQQKHFKSVSQQYRRVANDTMRSIESCVGRTLFENPYVSDRFSRSERAQLLADLDRQPKYVGRAAAADLSETEGRLSDSSPLLIESSAFQPSSPSLQGSVSASGGNLVSRIGSFFNLR